jgi:hypothetical protein
MQPVAQTACVLELGFEYKICKSVLAVSTSGGIFFWTREAYSSSIMNDQGGKNIWISVIVVSSLFLLLISLFCR